MNKMNKRGVFAQVVLGLIVLFVVIIGIVAITNYTQGSAGSFADSLGESITTVSDASVQILSPVFNTLLGLDRIGIDSTNKFLMILTFILMATIIAGIFDAAEIFGDRSRSQYINLVVSIIVSIIGVRFMPTDMWSSLTAPSSAFVATVLVGAPFLALALLSIRIKSNLASKVIWLFYLIFMSYLIFSTVSSTNTFRWIYLIFLVLAAVMLFFDSTVRKYFYEEKSKIGLEKALSTVGVLERQKIRDKLEKLYAIISSDAPPADIAAAEAEIAKLKAKYPALPI